VTEFRLLGAKWIPKDKLGLIGRNRKWGKLYRPRFQLGVGKGVRMAIVARDLARVEKAYLNIKAGTELIDSFGYIQSSISF